MRRPGLPGRGRPAAFLAAALLALVATMTDPAAALPPARGADPTARPTAAPPAVPHPAPEPTARPAVVWHGPRTERVVALTFDDGWNEGTLRRIFRVLQRERVPATFFVTGVYVQRAPGLWREIAAAGYPLANHTYLHRDMRRLTAHQVEVDLALTEATVERTTGYQMLPFYRPPYGARTAMTDRRVAAAGYPTIVMWDVTAADTGRRPSVVGVVRTATSGGPGSIVLLHAGPRVTPRALPAIIARYRARGFRFVTLPELIGLPAGGTWPAGADRAPRSDATGRTRAMDATPDPVARRPGAPAGGPEAGPGGSPDGGPGRGEPPSAAEPVPAAEPVRAAAEPPSAAAEPPPPAAREAAWARRDDTPGTVAVFSVVLLILLIALGAAAGRGRPDEESQSSAGP